MAETMNTFLIKGLYKILEIVISIDYIKITAVDAVIFQTLI
ncbi:MAG: hypothetical protein U5R06_09410 [candidate division KSB1 bacterium]|nr:hypothetical protein [candidate division KSB1 bacterium]